MKIHFRPRRAAELLAGALAVTILSLLLSSNPAMAQKGGGSKPAAPTGLTATAGQMQVTLSWNASSGVTSYRVKRSTVSGKSYVTVASPTATNYLDTNVTGGTKYYYVVTAVNAYGESAKSNQASATPSSPPPPTYEPKISYYIYGYSGGPHLAAMNADGQCQTELTSFGVGAPAFSPDGSQIAFNGVGPNGIGVYVMNKDGSGLRKVCPAMHAGGAVEWVRMPDGIERIAFEDTTVSGPGNIFLTNLSGTEVDQVTNHVDFGGVYSPSFSADGSTLFVFEYDDSANSDNQYVVAYRYASVDGLLVLVSRTVCYTFDTSAGPQIRSLACARTQNKLALAIGYGTNDLFLLDIDNPTSLVQLTATLASEQGVTWSPDDSKIAFSTVIGGCRTIATMPPVPGGAITNLSNNTRSGYSHERPYWGRTP